MKRNNYGKSFFFIYSYMKKSNKQQKVWKGRCSFVRVGTFKYWNNDWKGKRVGRYDGTKEYRHIVPTGNKVER